MRSAFETATGRWAMQSTEPGRPEPTGTDHASYQPAVGRRLLRLGVILWWVGVGSYAVARPLLVPTYTLLMVGTVVGLSLLALLVDSTADRSTPATAARKPWGGWVGVAGPLIAVVGGTVGLAGLVDPSVAGQPSLSTGGLVAGTLLAGGLIASAARISRPVAGLAACSIGLAWLAASEPVVETLVFDGFYGPLTAAAVVWLAPLCLLVGLWQAAGLGRWLADRVVDSGRPWPTETGSRPAVSRIAVGTVSAVVLIGWQTAGSIGTVGLATVPLGLVGAVALWGRPTSALFGRRTADEWLGPLAIGGGPIAVMALLGVGYRLPFGMVVAAGCLCCLGCCLAGSLVDRRLDHRPDRTSSTVRVGPEVVLDGGLRGVRLAARLVTLVAVVGGGVAVAEAAGVLTWLLSAVVWLSGGHWLAILLVVVGCCVALGAVLPTVAAYAVGALGLVPMIRLLTPVAELSAHLLVVYAVVAGSLLAVSQRSGEL